MIDKEIIKLSRKLKGLGAKSFSIQIENGTVSYLSLSFKKTNSESKLMASIPFEKSTKVLETPEKPITISTDEDLNELLHWSSE